MGKWSGGAGPKRLPGDGLEGRGLNPISTVGRTSLGSSLATRTICAQVRGAALLVKLTLRYYMYTLGADQTFNRDHQWRVKPFSVR